MSSSTYGSVVAFLPHSEVRANRIAWLDIAKGIGILFVIAGHALGGVIDSSLGFGAVPVRQMFLGIYLFHMPLFFILAGLLVEPRIRRGHRRFVRALLTSLVMPYFLWASSRSASSTRWAVWLTTR